MKKKKKDLDDRQHGRDQEIRKKTFINGISTHQGDEKRKTHQKHIGDDIDFVIRYLSCHLLSSRHLLNSSGEPKNVEDEKYSNSKVIFDEYRRKHE